MANHDTSNADGETGDYGTNVDNVASKDNKKGNAVIKQFTAMKADRYQLDKAYERAYRMSFPHLGQGFNWRQEVMNTKQQGRTADAWQDDMMTTIGPDTCRLLASAILSSLTPTNVRWFDIDVCGIDNDDLSQESKEWLEDAADIVWDNITSANYDAESMEFAIHLVVAGMGGLFIDWRDDLAYPGCLVLS